MRISIDGNIGSGKTFYLQRLEKDGYIVNHEDADKWKPWLEKFNSNMKRYALGFQLQILHDQYRLPWEMGKLNIYERSPYTLKNIFGDLLYEQNQFDPQEYKLHNTYVETLGWTPDVIIYLYCDPEICHQRVNTRFSIDEDSKMTLNYLNQLHLKHEIVFDDMNCSIPIYKINSMEDTETVYKNILDILNKLSKDTL